VGYILVPKNVHAKKNGYPRDIGVKVLLKKPG
jgi:hypothetical protein